MSNLFEQWNSGDDSGRGLPPDPYRMGPSSGLSRDDPVREYEPSQFDTSASRSSKDSEPFLSCRLLDWLGVASQTIGLRQSLPMAHLAVENNVMVMAATDGSIFRWNLNDDKTFEEIHVEQLAPVYSLFLDPNGAHCIYSLENGSVYYLHFSSNKPKRLKQGSQLRIDSVGWNREEGNEASTKPFIVGSDRGELFEVFLEGREKYFKRVYAFSGGVSIAGVQFECVRNISGEAKYFVAVVARAPSKKASKLYQFTGGPTIEAMFQMTGPTEKLRCIETTSTSSQICFTFWSRHRHEKGKTYAFLTGEGIYYGDLNIQASGRDANFALPGTHFKFPDTARVLQRTEPPSSMIVTEFHFILLFSRKIQALSRISNTIIFETELNYGVGRQLYRDLTKGTTWMNSESRISQVLIPNEDRDVWLLSLQKAQEAADNSLFEKALSHCKTLSQRQQVLNAQAGYLANIGEYEKAAMIFAKSNQSFEEVALRFVEAEQREALRIYLSEKLKLLRPDEKTQQTMLTTWLTEVYLDKFNSLQEQKGLGRDVERHAQILYDFKQFIHENKERLDPNITFGLLSSHGRTEEMLFYALLIEDYERVITYHIHRRDYRLALEVLTKAPVAKVEQLYYKYSPTLVEVRPKETFKAWEEAAAGLQTAKLIPAIVRYQNQLVARKGTAESDLALDFLEQVVQKGNKDPALHNLLLTILARYPNEHRLIRFIRKRTANQAYFDLKFALRVCTRLQRNKAMVYIYSAMGLYGEAVELALQVDVAMAKEVAAQPEDEEVRKKLWLLVAKHTIESGGNIKEAIRILNDVDPPGLLKIEDILPFFPDFVIIDDFKTEICQSLEDYNDRIERLKAEMKDYTESAELIRQDLKTLQKRSTIVSGNQRCGVCEKLVMSRGFYCFPCGHTFHSDCMMDEVVPLLSSAQRKSVKDVHARLVGLRDSPVGTPVAWSRTASGKTSDKIGDKATLQAKLDSIIAGECLFCGEIMIRSISQPFITEKEKSEVADWSL